MNHLVIGGVRSGKSAHGQMLAQNLADAEAREVVYLATAQALDKGMQERIEKHQNSRPEHWLLVEESFDLASVLLAPENQNKVILIECMTLWLTNLICLEDELAFDQHKSAFIGAIHATKAKLVCITSEVGAGIMPMNSMARRFGDEAGLLNQELARLSEQVELVCAGLPLKLK